MWAKSFKIHLNKRNGNKKVFVFVSKSSYIFLIARYQHINIASVRSRLFFQALTVVSRRFFLKFRSFVTRNNFSWSVGGIPFSHVLIYDAEWFNEEYIVTWKPTPIWIFGQCSLFLALALMQVKEEKLTWIMGFSCFYWYVNALKANTFVRFVHQ